MKRMFALCFLRAQRRVLLWRLWAAGWRWCPRLSAQLERLDEEIGR